MSKAVFWGFFRNVPLMSLEPHVDHTNHTNFPDFYTLSFKTCGFHVTSVDYCTLICMVHACIMRTPVRYLEEKHPSFTAVFVLKGAHIILIRT